LAFAAATHSFLSVCSDKDARHLRFRQRRPRAVEARLRDLCGG